MSEETKKKMLKHLCKIIAQYNESYSEAYYHYYMGYLLAMQDAGIRVEVFRNEYVTCDGEVYAIEDYTERSCD